MAVFERTNGGAQPGEFFGRELKFVQCTKTGIHTNHANVDSVFEKVTRVVANYSTISLIGTPASNVAMFVVEGLPSDVSGTAIVSELQTAANVATGGAGCVFAVFEGISGNTFV